MDAYDEILGAAGGVEGLAAENVQARIRGNLLMALSNSRGSLVLATGNKSETSVGYSTLYGDMAGGLSVIKDVPKQLVYELVRHRNAAAAGDLVPASIIERAPSAELRPDQRDEDSLPPYELLDRVLEGYVQRDHSRERARRRGMPADVVDEVVEAGQPRRVQAPPGGARDPDHLEGVRPRSPAADHEPLSGVGAATDSAGARWSGRGARGSGAGLNDRQ